jgi:hypothetical protein
MRPVFKCILCLYESVAEFACYDEGPDGKVSDGRSTFNEGKQLQQDFNFIGMGKQNFGNTS